MKKLILGLIVFSTLGASANQIKLLEIKSDQKPNAEPATLSIEVNQDSKIENIIYVDPDKPTDIRKFSVDQLKQKPRAIVDQGPVSVVEISAQPITINSLYLNIKYLYKFKVFGSERHDKKLKIFYESPTNVYLVTDTDTNKVVTKALTIIRMEGSKQKGIDHIETLE